MSFISRKSSIAFYHANNSVIEEGDAIANTTLPIALLQHRSLSFTPETSPRSFSWIVAGHNINEPIITTVHRWDETFQGKTFNEWRSKGHVKLRKPAYYITWSEKRQVYVNTYGPVSGLTLLPLLSILYAIDQDIGVKERLLLSAAKVHASTLVALSAIFIFFIATRFVSTGQALLISLSYGLGTCVWSVSSQNIWQQTVNLFFIIIGVFFLLKVEKKSAFGAWSGLMFGAAMACRMTSLLLLVSVFVYLVLYHRRSAVYFALTACIFPALIAWYNYYYFDSPFTFGQSVVGEELAIEKTGNPDVWQTPLWYGALGQLISPSRGLFVFSPFLIFSFWGIFRVWRDPAYRVLRPLTVGAIAIACIQFKWFDWWGGWTYGYRPLVDLVPLLMVFMIPVISTIVRYKLVLSIFSLTLAWSVFVQALGAMSYDKAGWNERVAHSVLLPGWDRRIVFSHDEAMRLVREHGGEYVGLHGCNMDYKFCRHRLWSITDNQIWYYITNYTEARDKRLPPGWDQLSIFMKKEGSKDDENKGDEKAGS
jgi:hypothetical protein